MLLQRERSAPDMAPEAVHRQMKSRIVVIYSAQKLVDALKGLDCRVNLIRFHESPEAPFKTSMPTTIVNFQNYLNRHGVICTLRASRGQDIDAACGLLAGRQE